MKVPEDGYICEECAKAFGCTWPEGHVATWHFGLCPVCEESVGLANGGDWNWPDKAIRGMRD